MRRNMKVWKEEVIAAKRKKAMPILSFPGAGLIGATVAELVRDGHLQAKCMESIAQKYDLGIAVSLMDLSVEAEAFGSPVHFSENEVPTVLHAIVHNDEEAEALKIPQAGDGRTGECIRGIREACELITDRPVFAGMIGPYSLAGRLLDMTEIMILCYEEPELVKKVLDKATDFLCGYAEAFKAAGACGVIMAEPAAGLLSPRLMEEFSTPYVSRICERAEDDHFMIMYHNCGNTVPLMNQIKAVDAGAYSFGNAIDLMEALKVIPQDRIVIGNIDPAGVLKNGNPETIRTETLHLLERCGMYPNFVIASGCDIPPQTSFENMDAFVAAVEEFYREQEGGRFL